jgi:hypothetical protein
MERELAVDLAKLHLALYFQTFKHYILKSKKIKKNPQGIH